MKQSVALAFGNVLRSAREAAGMSQERLASGARLDRTYPSLLERGLRSPTLATLLLLSEVLGVKPEVLVRRTEIQLHRSTCTRRKGHLQRASGPRAKDIP